MPDSKVIVALDFPDETSTLQLVEQLHPEQCRLKIGKELFTRFGPDLVRRLVDAGYDVFLDLKYHDIPNTVAKACMAAAELGVWMVNVHSLGGPSMLEAARKALSSDDAPLLIAVTILTSSNEEDLQAVGINSSPEEMVTRLASLAKAQGLDGVVCSARETASLKSLLGQDFKLVTPGIRLADDSTDDQKRIMTPIDAIQSGSDYLVIGRPITQAENPLQKLEIINAQIGSIL
jgi:orotidine-5'-phosphate decarboxylase